MEKSRVQIIKDFFFRPGEDTTKSFLEEIKKLSIEERNELATLICEKTGDTIKVE